MITHFVGEHSSHLLLDFTFGSSCAEGECYTEIPLRLLMKTKSAILAVVGGWGGVGEELNLCDLTSSRQVLESKLHLQETLQLRSLCIIYCMFSH